MLSARTQADRLGPYLEMREPSVLEMSPPICSRVVWLFEMIREIIKSSSGKTVSIVSNPSRSGYRCAA